MAILSDRELEAALATLAGWRVGKDGKAIEKQFRFPDFSAAFGFMARVALAAEKADHHPQWRNVHGLVEIELTTHTAGGVTHKDLALAQAIDIAADGSRR